MNGGKEQISARQLMFSAACYITGSSLLTTYITVTTKQETWIAVIAGYLVSLLIIGLYAILVHLYPGKDIVQISIIVFGNVFGRIVSLLFIYYFFSLTFLNTRNIGEFLNGFVMPQTPMVALLIMFIFICVWAVRCGVETMTRYSTLFVGIVLFVLFITSVLLIKDMKLSNLLPVFSLPMIKYVQATHTMAILPFCEVFTFFMIFPFVKEKNKINGAVAKGLTIGFAILLCTILRNAAVLGPLIPMLSSPNFEVIRLIDIGHVLTRMDILYVGVLLMISFFKVTIALFATVTAISRVFNLHSYRFIVLAVGALTVVFSLEAFGSVAESSFWGANVAVVYSTFFEVVLPVATLLTAACRKMWNALTQ